MSSYAWKYFTQIETFNEENNKTVKCDICGILLIRNSSSTTALLRHLKMYHENVISSDSVERIEKNSPMFREYVLNLVLFHAASFIPFKVIESEYFRQMMEALQPRFRSICANTLANKYVKEVFLVFMNKITEICKTEIVDSICLSFDMWQSKAESKYMGCCVSFINSEGNVRNFVIGTDEVLLPMTAAKVKDYINGVIRRLKEWTSNVVSDEASNFSYLSESPLTSRINHISIVTDGAGNMRNASKEITNQWIWCCVHRLNLVLKNSVKANFRCQMLFKKIAALPEFIYTLNSQLSPDMVFDNVVSTRFNSYQELFLQITKHSVKLKELSATNPNHTWLLSSTEIDMVCHISPVLNEFEQVIKSLSSETDSTIDKVLNSILGIKFSLDDMNCRHTETISFKENCHLKLDFYFPMRTLKPTSIYFVANYLNPSWKTYCINLVTDVARFKQSFFRKYSSLNEEPRPQSFDNLSGSLRLRTMAQANFQRGGVSWPDGLLQEEVHRYEGMTWSHERKTLDFWKENKSNFPILWKISMKVFTVSASTINCERAFSSAGRIVTPFRISLHPEKVRQLNIINKNARVLYNDVKSVFLSTCTTSQARTPLEPVRNRDSSSRRGNSTNRMRRRTSSGRVHRSSSGRMHQSRERSTETHVYSPTITGIEIDNDSDVFSSGVDENEDPMLSTQRLESSPNVVDVPSTSRGPPNRFTVVNANNPARLSFKRYG